MGRLLTLRRNLSRLLTRNEVDDNFVGVATDFTGEVDPATLEGAYVLPYMRWADIGTGWVRRRNVANDAWVNEQRLHRASLAIFGADEVPVEDVGPICIVGKGYAEWDSAGGGYRLRSGPAVGTPGHWPLRSSIPAGQIPQDGQTVPRATYPDLAAMVIAGTLPVVSEETWQSDPTHRGKYTLGDGTTTIRLPDLNGKSAGSLGAVVWRGDGAMSAATNGLIQRDAFQGHTFGTPGAPLGTYGINSNGLNPGGLALASMRGDNASVAPILTNGTHGTPRVASETRALNVTGVWTVHAFGAVVNPGSVDAAQLATDLAATQSLLASTRADLATAQSQLFGVGQIIRPRTTVIQAWYQNTSTRPILVGVTFMGTGAANVVTAGYLNSVGSTSGMRSVHYDLTSGAGAGTRNGFSFMVPPGVWWMVDAVNATVNEAWEYS
ncbi:phage tail protein [Achromobacter spanius]|uniref:phage tail protein n=1 Tax=Achromobacter spanius TaxID=217203 RepID=UPI003209D03E